MSKILFDKDISLAPILNKKIGVIGYGNQGRAQALNLNDSGVDVSIGLRDNSSSIEAVKQDCLKYKDIDTLIKESDILSVMIPDSKIDSFLDQNVKKFKNETYRSIELTTQNYCSKFKIYKLSGLNLFNRILA